MGTLRISQHPGYSPGRYRCELSAAVKGLQALSAAVEFAFALSPQQQENIRWYLEDFLEFDQDPAPILARGIEREIEKIGEDLFCAIFQANEEARDLWSAVRPHLADTRVEISSEIAAATAIPWELIRDPRVGPLALRARSLVRTQRGAVVALAPEQADAGKVRILLVICRPEGSADVPFRSVASRLVKGLTESARETFDLDVLRPPTFEALGRVLRQAKLKGQPYHVVHFDGHGVWADPTKLSSAGRLLSRLRLDAEAKGNHGFLLFEDPDEAHNADFIDGTTLGRLLAESAVPLLVLNACQSGYAQAAAVPHPAGEGCDLRGDLAAYGSLAQEVIDAGAAGVVAMRYSVYVVTAAQFVAELYAALAQGHTLGEAVTQSRKHLADQPERHVAYDARPLQDWCVPIVYERTALRLWPVQRAVPELVINFDEHTTDTSGLVDRELPARPDVGFHGRDETLYAIDRAFDHHSIVLLHAYAGSGKTATVAEFARWYLQTGGVEGVLFSSFERHLPLERLLDKIGEAFGPMLVQAGVQWDAVIATAKRRDIALRVLAQVPRVLWIWDNVEPVTGFPRGTQSHWTAQEQRELIDFLRAASETNAKFLLSSRRDEQDWLGDMPVRVDVPPMPMRERLQLAAAFAERFGRRLRALPDLRPLLEFTRGNPLTLSVTVRQAMRDGLATSEHLRAYLEKLRSGELAFPDEKSEGRSKSLGASLSYGFEQLGEEERKVLAVLHLFQGIVDVNILLAMGDAGLGAIQNLERSRACEILDRAAEIGLLTKRQDGVYAIHPALPWFFSVEFKRHYLKENGGDVRAARAFTEAVAQWGSSCQIHYEAGHNVLNALEANEDNLLAAWNLSRANGWWRATISAMQGLSVLYQIKGRDTAWGRLVDAAKPDFVNPSPDTPGPIPGREDAWSIFTQYQVRLARVQRDWTTAKRLQELCIKWDRSQAAPALAADPTTWDDRAIHTLRTLASSIEELAHIEKEQKDPHCVDGFLQAYELYKKIGHPAPAANCALFLGSAHLEVQELYDLNQAEHWYRESLRTRPEHDRLGQIYCLGNLGNVAFMRFEVARNEGRPKVEIQRHLIDAANLQEQVLQLCPATALNELAIAHYQRALIYVELERLDKAMPHFRQAVRCFEQIENTFKAAHTRYVIAYHLAAAKKFLDARAYAEAALANFQSFGVRAEQELADVRALLDKIELEVLLNEG